MVERLKLVRYLMIGGSLISAFLNLIDELHKGAGLWQILFYSGTLLFIAVFLILVDKKWALGFALILGGFLMLFDDLRVGDLSPAVMLFGWGLYLSDNKYLNYIVYFIISIFIVAIHVFLCGTPEDAINTLIGYTVFFALNELIYKQRQENVKAGG